MRRFEKDRKYHCGNYPIDAIETFFNSLLLPETIDLNKWEHIKNVPLFVSSHIAFLKKNNRNYIFFQYYKRLLHLKEILVQLDNW